MLSLVAAATVLSAQASLPMVEPKVVRASMFKNGYAVILREAKIPAGTTQFHIPTASPSTLGTFWILSDGGAQLKSAVATSIEKTDERHAGDLAEIISANQGKKVTLTVHLAGREGPEQVQGEMLSSTGNAVVIKMADGKVRAFNKGSVIMIESVSGELIYKVPTKTEQRVIRLNVTGSGSIFTLSLEQGMSWAPAYAVDITNPDKLKITGKATIINDLVDLNDVEARLITGFPHIRFLGTYDPFVSPETMKQFADQLMGFGGGGGLAPGSALTQNAARMYDARGDRELNFQPMDPSQLEGFQAEDLFFYRQPNVNLMKGERGYYVLFTAESDYEHIYTVDLPGDSAERIINTMNGNQPDVWHELKFKNTSKMPLTTAAATTIKSEEIIGQDMLDYTSPGADAHLKITKALDIQVDGKAEEVSREDGAIKDRNGNNLYDLVTVRGEIEIRNMKAEKVQLKLTKQIEGEVASTTPQAETIKLPTGINQINATSIMTWRPEVESGKTVTLRYSYTVYVRARR